MEYYLIKDGEKTGPFTYDELATQGLTPDTLVWNYTMTEPTAAKHLLELAPLMPQSDPTPPPFNKQDEQAAEDAQPAAATPPPPPAPRQAAPAQYAQPRYGEAVVTALPPMSFGEAIKTCLSKYATFTGRARRSEYWWWVLFTFLVSMAFSLFGSLTLTGTEPSQGMITLSGILNMIVCLALFLPTMAVTFRRLHDTNHSGWLLGINYCLGILIAIVVGVMAGNIFMLYQNGVTLDNISQMAEAPGVTDMLFEMFGGLMILFGVLALIVLIISIIILVWTLTDSNRYPNHYGESPKYKS